MNKMTVIENIKRFIENKESYVLEAGAGSGKTYTLIQTINYLIETKAASLQRENKKIVCITYTNVAKNEIIERLENNPLLIVSTIHDFLWGCIKLYNKQLLIELDKLNALMHKAKPEKYSLGLLDRIHEVTYDDSGFRDFENGNLHHDDVISISNQMFQNYPLLTKIISQKYPYILIDEYQDTATETIDAIINGLLEKNRSKVLLGFYGDSYQKIYNDGVGTLQPFVDSGTLALVTKPENYRSSVKVIELLNNVRENIVQIIPENKEQVSGSVTFINCTNYPAPPPKGIRDYESSLLPQKDSNFKKIISDLEDDGWCFSENHNDKILIIANSKVAQRGNFGELYKVYNKRYTVVVKEKLLKREDPFSSYFTGTLDKKTSKERETGIEHLVSFWQKKEYNKVFRFLNKNGGFKFLAKHADKTKIEEKLTRLIELRSSGTVKDVFDYCITNDISVLPKRIKRIQDQIAESIEKIEDDILKRRTEKNIDFYNSLMKLPYSEFINVFKYIQNQTAFSTKHGTKGEEYRNVLVVIDDTSWKSEYNFENFFNDTEVKPERKLRTKNLFYVSCSRAKENLVVLALSQMGKNAMTTINGWFGSDNIRVIKEKIK